MKKVQSYQRVLRRDGVSGVLRRAYKSHRLRRSRVRGGKLNEQFGWRSQHPIVVIESDDWGAEHIPSLDALESMKKVDGFPVDAVGHFDSLETAEDMERLYDVLYSHEGGDKKPAVITANFVMANPDYNAIKENDFREFKSKLIREGWNHESDSDGLWEKYRAGIKSNIMAPQLHGMVHFSPDEWLRRLRQGDTVSLKAFDWQMIGEKEDVSGIGLQSMAPIYHTNAEDIMQLVTEGSVAFRNSFGKDSLTSIAPCYGWQSPETEEAFLAHNIRVMQGREYQHLPGGEMALHYLGELGFRGILYLTRNCMLEPVTNNTTAEQCIFKIATLFEKGFPAILSSHRINYTSRVSAEARDKGLAVLDSVLKKVKEMFSEVEFLSSDKLAERILAEKQTGNPG